MPRYRERRWPWIMAGYAAFFAVLAPLTAFLYDSAAAADRPMMVRTTAAFVVAVGILHLRAYFRGDPRWEPPSPFIDSLSPPPIEPKLDPGFSKLRDDVANASESMSYFDKVLWPRLDALAQARGLDGELPRPSGRSWFGRGPSPRVLARLIRRLEEQP
jgi:hypothetical protein